MESVSATILIVEDHRPTRKFLADNLAADGYELLEAETARRRPAADGDRLPRPGDRRSRAFPTATGSSCCALVREADRVAGSSTPTCRSSSSPAAPASSTGSAAFDRGADDYVIKAVLLPRAARADRRAAAPQPAAARRSGGCASGRSSSTRRAAGLAPTASRWSCPRRSSRCCGRWPPSRRACSRARSCCAASGAFGRWARRARSTRTPRGCARSSRIAATGSSSTCGASATGSSTGAIE